MESCSFPVTEMLGEALVLPAFILPPSYDYARACGRKSLTYFTVIKL